MLRFREFIFLEFFKTFFSSKSELKRLYCPLQVIELMDRFSLSSSQLSQDSNFAQMISSRSTNSPSQPDQDLKRVLRQDDIFAKTRSGPCLDHIKPRISKTRVLGQGLGRQYDGGFSIKIGESFGMIGVRGLDSIRSGCYIDLIDVDTCKVKASMEIKNPPSMFKSFQYVQSKKLLFSLQSIAGQDYIVVYQIQSSKIKKIRSILMGRCSAYDYNDETQLIYSAQNDMVKLVPLVNRKAENLKSFNVGCDVLALKYVPEVDKVFIGSKNVKVVGGPSFEFEKELPAGNDYIAKFEYDVFSRVLYGFSFESDIYGWKLEDNGDMRQIYSVKNDFKSIYPMIINPISKSVIVNQDNRELVEINLKTKKTKRWFGSRGRLLAYNSSQRSLILQ